MIPEPSGGITPYPLVAFFLTPTGGTSPGMAAGKGGLVMAFSLPTFCPLEAVAKVGTLPGLIAV